MPSQQLLRVAMQSSWWSHKVLYSSTVLSLPWALVYVYTTYISKNGGVLEQRRKREGNAVYIKRGIWSIDNGVVMVL